ncbi:hypothetical protein [Pseudoduganella aquatica]|uniref:hypothetical protein n=1 Tax=Pseudoduganella aquatica TaxID=2660641 RepID=UPI001E3E15A5|nr:hypothetical protein [Pseudoduganella aquatica]
MGAFSKRINIWSGMIERKGPGYCVLCGHFGELTRDHVPPKGCAEISNSVLTRLIAETDSGKSEGQSLRIQGGLKFKSICGDCNNGRLGTKYDPELKAFVDSMRAGLTIAAKNVALHRVVHAKADLHAVARSVIGHLLAAHAVTETEAWRADIGASESLRQYFLDPALQFPAEWRLYCWPYFSRRQIILRHAAWMDVSLDRPSDKTIYGHVLKFLPFGFWLVRDQPSDFAIPMPDITPTGMPVGLRETVWINLRDTPHMSYPENPSGHHVMLCADEQGSMMVPVKHRAGAVESPRVE